MPFTAAALALLPDAIPPGPLAIPIETVDVLLVTTLPKASSTATVTDGLSAVPAVPLVGVCLNANWLAASGLTLIEPVVAPVNPLSLTVSV